MGMTLGPDPSADDVSHLKQQLEEMRHRLHKLEAEAAIRPAAPGDPAAVDPLGPAPAPSAANAPPPWPDAVDED